MIHYVRTCSIAPGKLGDALAFAKEISEYLHRNYDVKVEIALPVGGNPHRIGWRSVHANLTALETFQTSVLADPKYIEIVSKGGNNFIAGSLHDEIWRTL